MTLEQLAYLLELSRHHSISEAADRLFITQSALSMSLNALEKELGVILFHRSNKGITPTPDGQIVIQYAQDILQKITELHDFAATRSASYTFTFNLASHPLFHNTVMPAIISQLLVRFPQAKISCTECKDTHILEFFKREKIDLLIFAYTADEEEDTLRQYNTPSTICQRTLCTNLRMYVRADHPLAQAQTELDFAALCQFPILVSKTYWSQVNRHLNSVFEQLQQNLIPIDSISNIERMLFMGDYIFLSPSQFEFNSPFIASGQIIPLNLPDPTLAFPIYFATIAQAKSKFPFYRELVELTQQIIAQIQL